MVAAPELQICACEDDALYHRALQVGLGSRCRFDFSADGATLLQRIAALRPHLVLLDLRLDGAALPAGFAILQQVRAAWPRLPVVVHSGLDDDASVVRALALGANDFVPKRQPMAAVRARLLAWAERAERPPAGAAAAAVDAAMVGDSAPVQALRVAIGRLRGRPGHVIVRGESGAGKELVARALRRPAAPFVAVDAATLQESTALSALFGHERGAFTGAAAARRGLLEEADGGVLYLDEIGNLTLGVQATLLRALQEQQVVRLGSSRVRQLHFRVVCATHRDLAALCRVGAFRHDLLARLDVFTVEVPPLRARPEDLPALVAHLLARLGAPSASLAACAHAALRAYPWPGNVRELGHVLQYMLAMADGPVLTAAHLPERLHAWGKASAPDTASRTRVVQHGYTPAVAALPDNAPISHAAPSYVLVAPDHAAAAPPHAATAAVPSGSAPVSLAAQLRAAEHAILLRAYDDARGNISRIARALAVERSTLHRKLIRFGIHRPRR